MNALMFLQKILYASLGLFIIMLAFRVAIMFAFSSYKILFQKPKDVFKSYFLGARYDLKIIAIINTLPLLYAIIVYSVHANAFFHISFYLLFAYYFVSYLVVIILMGIDVGFFSYFNEHINYLIFGFFDDDTKALIDTMRKNYNVPLIFGLILLALVGLYFLVWWIVIPHFAMVYYHTVLDIVVLVATIIIDFLLARGTISSMPLGLMHARVSSNDFLNKLCMNGIFSFFKALKQRKESKRGTYNLAKKYHFDDKMEQALNIISQKSNANLENFIAAIEQKVEVNALTAEKPPHVVLVMMESFASHILTLQDKNLDLMANLQAHFDEDIVFKNFTSDGQGTIESFLALLCAMPHRPNANNLTESNLINSKIKSSAAQVFAAAGYETSAVYGGSLSWRNLGTFLEKQGFDHVEGDMHIKEHVALKSKSYDHCWGVHDEYLYDYLKYKLQQVSKPQFILALTTSNHPPFEYPETYKAEKIEISPELEKRLLCSKKIMQGRLAVYQYSNAMAGQFLDYIKSSEFKDNTIVALTGDHSFWGMYNYNEDEIFTKQTVPFYLYIPTQYQPQQYDAKTFASHKDILPTLYHLSLSDTEYVSLGKNIFSNDKTYAFNSSEMIADDNGVVCLAPTLNYYTWGKCNSVTMSAASESLENLLQQYKAALSVTDVFYREHH